MYVILDCQFARVKFTQFEENLLYAKWHYMTFTLCKMFFNLSTCYVGKFTVYSLVI